MTEKKNLINMFTKFSIFSNIAAYIGGIEIWEYVMMNLNSKTKKAWIDCESQYRRLEYVNYGDVNDLIDLIDEFELSSFATYEFLNLTFNCKSRNLEQIEEFLKQARHFRSYKIHNLYLHHPDRLKMGSIENLKTISQQWNTSELNNFTLNFGRSYSPKDTHWNKYIDSGLVAQNLEIFTRNALGTVNLFILDMKVEHFTSLLESWTKWQKLILDFRSIDGFEKFTLDRNIEYSLTSLEIYANMTGSVLGSKKDEYEFLFELCSTKMVAKLKSLKFYVSTLWSLINFDTLKELLPDTWEFVRIEEPSKGTNKIKWFA